MEALRLLGAVASLVLAGWVTLEWIDRSGKLLRGLWIRLALSYPLGVGVVTLQMFWMALAGIPFHVGWIIAPWGVAGTVLLARRVPRPANVRWSVRLRWPEWIALGLIAFQLFYVFARSLAFPIVGWDAFSHWLARGSAFFIDRGISPEALFFDYPLLISLGSTWVYLWLGEVNDQLVKILHPCFYLSLLAVFGYTVRVLTTRILAFVMTAMLATLPYLVIHGGGLGLYLGNDFVGYSDLALSFYFLAAASFFCLYLKTQERPALTLSFIWLGLGAWTKNEGIAFAAFGTFVAVFHLFWRHARAEAFKKAIWGSALVLLIVGPWLVYLAFLGAERPHLAQLNFHALLEGLNRLPVILTTMGQDAMRPMLFNLVWPVALLVIFANPRALFRPSYSPYLVTMIALQGACYVLVYMIRELDLKWQLATTSTRLLLHLTPMVFLAAAVHAHPLLKKPTASVPAEAKPAV